MELVAQANDLRHREPTLPSKKLRDAALRSEYINQIRAPQSVLFQHEVNKGLLGARGTHRVVFVIVSLNQD